MTIAQRSKYSHLYKGAHKGVHQRRPDVSKVSWIDYGSGREKKDRYDQYAAGEEEPVEDEEGEKNPDQAVNLDLTRPMKAFERNSRHQCQSVEPQHQPFNYGRGAQTRNHVDRFFHFSKDEQLKLNDGELRVLVPKSANGLIIGRRHERRIRMEEDFNVTLRISRGECQDESTPIIISSENADNRENCRDHILNLITGRTRDPPPKDEDSSEEEEESDIIETDTDRNNETDDAAEPGEVRNRVTLPKVHIRKFLYNECSVVRMRTTDEITQWREPNDIDVNAMNKIEQAEMKEFRPCYTFEEAFSRFPCILSRLQTQEFTKPTPIQSQLWPVALAGRDAIGISQTGSGKTLAFLAPLIAHAKYGGVLTQRDTNQKGEDSGDEDNEAEEFNMNIKEEAEAGEPLGLVIAPTRELAQQIEREIHKLFSYDFIIDDKKNRRLSTLLCVGGTDRRQNQNILADSTPPTIVVGTPGRLKDLCTSQLLNLSKVTFLVLDEADRMLDEGFRGDIEKIITKYDMPKQRQIVMTSATWPEDIRKFSRKYMSRAIKIRVGKLDLSCVKSVTQSIVKVGSDGEKYKKLCEYIDKLRRNGREESDNDVSDDDDVEINLEERPRRPRSPSPEPLIEPEPQQELVDAPNNAGWGDEVEVENNWLSDDDGGQNENQATETATPQPNSNPWKREKDFIPRDFKMIIFCGRKQTVDMTYRALVATYGNFSKLITPMHGDYDQDQRTRAIQRLTRGEVQILVATDVACRGIDIKDITHVFCYDMSFTIDEHCHRIGRTGRAGRTGIAVTLFNYKYFGDIRKADELWELLKESTVEGGPIGDNKDYKWLARISRSAKNKRELDAAAGKKY